MATSARGLHPVVGLAALGLQVEIGAGVEAALAEVSETKPAIA